MQLQRTSKIPSRTQFLANANPHEFMPFDKFVDGLLLILARHVLRPDFEFAHVTLPKFSRQNSRIIPRFGVFGLALHETSIGIPACQAFG